MAPFVFTIFIMDARCQEDSMQTALDRLKEMSEFLRVLLFLDEEALRAAVDEGFRESSPEWRERLPREYWATSLLTDITESSKLLDERLTPPGAVKTTHVSITAGPIEIRPATAAEKEALRRERGDTKPDTPE